VIYKSSSVHHYKNCR